MDEHCKNCGAKVTPDDDFCAECGSKIDSDTMTCPGCGEMIDANSRFCKHCGRTLTEEINFCANCGTEAGPGEDFCAECGAALKGPSRKAGRDRKIIIGAFVALAAIAVIAAFLAGSAPDSEIPLESVDFGVVRMLAPEGSQFVETNSLPSYGDIGGYVILENAGNYSHDVFSIMFSTIKGGSDAPTQDVALDRVEGDIHIYKDRNGGDGYYITRQVGDYKIDVIGSNEEAIIRMLESAEVATTTEVG